MRVPPQAMGINDLLNFDFMDAPPAQVRRRDLSAWMPLQLR